MTDPVGPYPWGAWFCTGTIAEGEGVWCRLRPYGSQHDGISTVMQEFEVRGWNMVGDGPDEEDVAFRGDIKWDGCLNLVAGETCMVHICGPEDWAKWHTAIRMIWEAARPHFNHTAY